MYATALTPPFRNVYFIGYLCSFVKSNYTYSIRGVLLVVSYFFIFFLPQYILERQYSRFEGLAVFFSLLAIGEG